jgi:hypothetical protein
MSSTYSNLKFEIIEVGGSSGQWGGITNTNIGTSIEQSIVGMATLASGDFISNTATLPYTNTNAAQNFRAFCLNITATLSGAGTVEVPAIQKPYLVLNNSSGGFAVTVKVSGLTGVSIPNGKGCLVYNNGTDVGAAITHLTSLTLATPLLPASGGTGITSLGSGVATWLGTPSSANLAAAVTDETGTGSLVFATSPTLVTPNLGTPSTLVGTNITGTAAGLSIGGTSASTPKLLTANFTVEESGGNLIFKYGATTIASMTSAGVFTTISDITGNGTP